jgi:hypothetical protein
MCALGTSSASFITSGNFFYTLFKLFSFFLIEITPLVTAENLAWHTAAEPENISVALG